MKNLDKILDTVTQGLDEIRKAMTVYPGLQADIVYQAIPLKFPKVMVIATVDVTRTQSGCSIFKYEIMLTCDDNNTLGIMTVGIDPFRLVRAQALTSKGTSGVDETIDEEAIEAFCPDQISAFTVEGLTPNKILSDFYAKIVTVTRHGRNGCGY